MNWQPAAFDPQKGLIFIPAVERASVFTKSDPDKMIRGKRGLWLGSGGSIAEPPILSVRAIDAATGVRKWEYRSPTSQLSDHSGLLATAGGWSSGYPEACSSRSMLQLGRSFGTGLGGILGSPPSHLRWMGGR